MFHTSQVVSQISAINNMGVEPKIGGKPPKWMVYNGKPYLNGMIWGVFPYFWFNTHMFSRYPKILTRLVGPGDLRLHVSPLMDLQHRWRLQATSPAGHNMATWVGKKPPTIWGGVLDLKLGENKGSQKKIP